MCSRKLLLKYTTCLVWMKLNCSCSSAHQHHTREGCMEPRVTLWHCTTRVHYRLICNGHSSGHLCLLFNGARKCGPASFALCFLPSLLFVVCRPSALSYKWIWPSFLPSFLPSFPPSFLPSFLLRFLRRWWFSLRDKFLLSLSSVARE